MTSIINTGGFINADNIAYLGLGDNINSYNTFSYCGNNPVMFTDSTGNFPFGIIIILSLGVILGGILGYNSDVKIGQTQTVEKSLSLETDETVTE